MKKKDFKFMQISKVMFGYLLLLLLNQSVAFSAGKFDSVKTQISKNGGVIYDDRLVYVSSACHIDFFGLGDNLNQYGFGCFKFAHQIQYQLGKVFNRALIEDEYCGCNSEEIWKVRTGRSSWIEVLASCEVERGRMLHELQAVSSIQSKY